MKRYILRRILGITLAAVLIFENGMPTIAMNRQQALGNIYMLGMNGCKLYINRNGQIDKHLSKQLHCSVSYIDEIQQLEFSKFISISQNERMNNYKQILKINETEYKMKKWNEFFEEE